MLRGDPGQGVDPVPQKHAKTCAFLRDFNQTFSQLQPAMAGFSIEAAR